MTLTVREILEREHQRKLEWLDEQKRTMRKVEMLERAGNKRRREYEQAARIAEAAQNQPGPLCGASLTMGAETESSHGNRAQRRARSRTKVN